MFELTIRRRFSAAHQIEGYPGNCSNLHGHNWLVEVRVGVNTLDELGMAFDFRKIKEILDTVLNKLDHTNLNENPLLNGKNPTAEMLAITIYTELKENLTRLMETEPNGKSTDMQILSVDVWESDNAGVRYSERDIN
ncbi:6-carboxytetrahydropterin synthase QueD [bacterium]|nr:MAG: 6-carboxytetrahydropterin synthase QueD [bacterium]